MFTPADRARVREVLVAAGHDDPRVNAAALTGSAALGREDRWSDLDLALCVGADTDLDAVVEDWSARMYGEHGAVHHVDIWRGTMRHLVGMAWLYALHARSGIVRGRRWHAEYMLSAARDQVLALACVRHGVPAAHARGVDALPAEEIRPLEAAPVGSLDPTELERARRVVVERLMVERADPDLAERLAGALTELAQPASPSGG